LVEGPSKSAVRRERNGAGELDATATGGIGQLTGRTACDRIVVFEGPERLTGRLVPVRIEDASAVTLFGQVVTAESNPVTITITPQA